MFGDHFLHPDHVVPGAEFVAALVEFSDHIKADVCMKPHAVVVQMLVRDFRETDAGIQAENVLRPGDFLDFFIEHFPDAHFAAVLAQVNACLHSPVISRSADEGTGVGVAEKLAVLFRGNIRVTLQRFADAVLKFL